MNPLDLHLGDAEPWRRFLEGDAPNSTVPSVTALRERWERVRALGVAPDGPPEAVIVSSPALAERRERMGPLLARLEELLAPARARFEDRDFRLLFADADGVVLHAAGGGEFEPEAERVRLIEGSRWSEVVQGTNAIGTALVEERPVTVFGAAHFSRPNHGLVCYGAPVHGPDGALRGVLDATSFAACNHPLGGLALAAAARTVEDELRRQAYQRLGPAAQRLVAQVLLRSGHAAMLVERTGVIRRANRAALASLPELLRTRSRSVDGLISVDAQAEKVLGIGWSGLEQAALRGRGTPLLGPAAGRFSLEVEPVLDTKGSAIAVVVFLVAVRSARHAPRPTEAKSRVAFERVSSQDPRVAAAIRTAARLASSDLPLLLLAETGTGKDLMARAIHAASHRADEPFVALNCAAVSGSLLAAELFGHGPGAFTGASPNGRDGLVAAADGGTLFLDEVAEMPAPLQAALLRFLEDGSYHRVGESKGRRADVRLLSATCRDLPTMVEQGTFRSDLFYRLRGATIGLPPLRERADFDLVVTDLLVDLARDQGWAAPPRVTPPALHWLEQQPWPGNIRELKNVLLRALVLAEEGETLTRAHLEDELPPAAPPPSRDASAGRARSAPRSESPRSLEEAERETVLRALEAADGNVSEAARILGVARSTVYRLMKKHQLSG